MDMLRRLASPQNLPIHEVQQIIRPGFVGVFLLCIVLAAFTVFTLPGGETQFRILFLAVLGTVYSAVHILWFAKLPYQQMVFQGLLLVIYAGLSIITLLWIPTSLLTIPAAVILLVITLTSLLLGRRAAYVYMGLVLLGFTLVNWLTGASQNTAPGIWAISILTIVIVEFVASMLNVNNHHIRRLQTINEFSRQINSTIEREHVLSILGDAIQKAIEADTYFMGVGLGRDRLYLELVYDDGAYFPPQEINMAGTLSGWVVRNQSSLFIPDLRRDVNLEGVQVILTGNNRDSACWMGVPMKAGSINGVLAVASYTPNAFDRTALELLENLAQHTALALDNANHHSEVEAQARLDSLTEVYNHGYIVHILRQVLEKARSSGAPLSLVMLDIDHFKQYNDVYGHQVGDEVLVRLAQAIKQHIKATDSVGRWGGEEFTIVLPNASGSQASQVALRLQETLRTLSLHPQDEKTLPFPTISQGIAVFPNDAEDGDSLIQLADRRLYIAKNRGRNQVEPGIAYWEKSIPGTKNEQ